MSTIQKTGKDAVILVEEHDSDDVTMDVEMPVMDAIEPVQTILRDHPVLTMMLSAVTMDGVDDTLEPLDKVRSKFPK